MGRAKGGATQDDGHGTRDGRRSAPTRERVFLGLARGDGRPPLRRAARWLVDTFGADMWPTGRLHPECAAVIVALPGARAGRLLEAHLAELAAPDLAPPRITTVGHLPDVLLPALGETASGSERAVAWALALREAGDDRLRPLLPHPPSSDDLAGLLALGAELRALHAELASEGLDFGAVRAVVQRIARAEDGHDGPRPDADEVARWTALADVQRRYLALLGRSGRIDPHDARRAALADADVRPAVTDAHVVLVGAVELSGMQRRALRLARHVTALVLSDDDARDAFDELGAARPEAWADAALPLDTARWHVVGRPAEQAATALALARGGGASGVDVEHDARRVTIGVPWRDVVPHLERCAADLGWTARDAAGTPLLRTPPGRLLEALAEHLRQRRFETLSALLRHPDVQRALPYAKRGDPAHVLDAYAAQHLPERVPDTWRLPDDTPPELLDGDSREARDARSARERNARLAQLVAWLHAGLGPLAEGGLRALHEWARPLLRWLVHVYGGRRQLPRPGVPLPRGDGARPDAAEAYVTAGALDALRELLEELADVHERTSRALRLTAGDALALLLRAASPIAVAPPPHDDALELLGPLELLLDDAPRLVITGFHEGSLPAVSRAGRLLPDGLRRALGLPDAKARLAREACILSTLLRSRDTFLVTGRVTARNDPLLPSRLAFHGEDEAVVERVRHLLRARALVPAPHGGSAAPPRALPRIPAPTPVTAMSITSFRTYLRSPYQFYLERVARAQPGERELELSPLQFGNLGHEVLQLFGTSDLRDSADADAIAARLRAILHDLVERRYGDEARAAVAIQVMQLGQRLDLVAKAQAVWRGAGWRIEHVEWAPEGGSVPFVVDGEPIALRGRVDRIDVHERSGQRAILDYKTGNSVPDPDKAHRKQGDWIDLQLPLYTELVRPLAPQGELVLGYVALPSEAKHVGFKLAGWTPAELAEARGVAERVVRDVRAGRFFELGDFRAFDPIVSAIAGEGFLGDDDEGAGDASGEGAS